MTEKNIDIKADPNNVNITGPFIVNRYLPRFETLTQILSTKNGNNIATGIEKKFNEDNNFKNSRNKIKELDISKFITAININETIESAGRDTYDECEIELKMDIDTFRWYFGDGLGQIQTGHWITIQRPTAYYANNYNALNLKNDPIWNDTSDKPIKAYYNHENEILYEKCFNNATAMFQSDSGVRETKPTATQKKRPKKTLEQTKKEALQKGKEKKITNKEIKDYKTLLETEAICIFFGVLTNIQQRFVIDNNGNQLFFIKLACESFIFSLTKSDYLAQMPERKLVLKDDVIANNLNKYEYRFDRQNQIKNFGIDSGAYSNAFNRILKTPEYYTNLHSYYGTGQNIENQKNFSGIINVRSNMTNIIRSFGTNYLPSELHPFNVEYNSSNEIIDPITNDVLVPNGFLTVGSMINIVTEQQHLPESCVYRQFLPMKSVIGTQFAGFKNFGVNRTQPWNLLIGTFVPDPNLIECFPLLIPIINYSEIHFNKTINNTTNKILDGLNLPVEPLLFERISDVVREFYIKLGAIPCIIYRLKTLSPDLALNMDNYKSLISNAIIANEQLFQLKGVNRDESGVRYGDQLKNHLAKNIQFGSEKIYLDSANKNLITKEFSKSTSLINQDACNADLIPNISINELTEFNMVNDESQRINSVYVTANNLNMNLGTPIGANQENNGTVGKIFQWYGILMDGLRLYTLQYPFLADTGNPGDRFTKEFLLSMAERLYSIYGEGNKLSFGSFTFVGELSPEILKGSWLRVRFNDDIIQQAFNYSDQSAETLSVLKNLAKYNDFYCYVLGINRSYIIDEASGVLQTKSTIRFSRGKFGLMPPLFPELFDLTVNTAVNPLDKIEELDNKNPLDIILKAYRKNIPNQSDVQKGDDIFNTLWLGASAKSFTNLIDPTVSSLINDEVFMKKIKTADIQNRISNIRSKNSLKQQDLADLAFYTYLIDVLNAYNTSVKNLPEFSYESYINIYQKLP